MNDKFDDEGYTSWKARLAKSLERKMNSLPTMKGATGVVRWDRMIGVELSDGGIELRLTKDPGILFRKIQVSREEILNAPGEFSQLLDRVTIVKEEDPS